MIVRGWESGWQKLTIGSAIVAVAAVGGYFFGHTGAGFRELVIAVLVFASGLLLLAPDEGFLRAGFYLWIASFAVGWRQLWITSNLKVHPTEALIWLLFGILLARRLVHRQPVPWLVPSSVVGLLLLSGVAAVTASDHGIPLDVILAELKALLVLVPILYVTGEMVQNVRQYQGAILAMALTALYVAILGLTEYFTPSVVAPLRGFFAAQGTIVSQQGFVRADFTFFGGAISSVYLSVVLFPAVGGAVAQKQTASRLAMLAGGVLCGLGVYLSGNRGPLFGVALALLIYTLLNWKHGWLLLASVVVLQMAPPTFFRNVAAVYDQRSFLDTSVQSRENLLRAGLKLVENSPVWGNGLGASGWVHNDLIQIAADAGVPALLLFLFWYSGQMRQLYGAIRLQAPAWAGGRGCAAGVLAGLGAGLVNLGSETILVLPHLIIPLWFLLAIAGQLSKLIGEVEPGKG